MTDEQFDRLLFVLESKGIINDRDIGYIGCNVTAEEYLSYKGHWIVGPIMLTTYPPQYNYECSECHEITTCNKAPDYCPKCHADMRK